MASGSFASGLLGTAQGVASIGFFAGALTGIGAGFTNGFITGIGNSLPNGESFGRALGSGFGDGLRQGLIGGGIGGLSAGIKSASKGLNFFTGVGKFDISEGVGAHGDLPDTKILKGKFVGNFYGTDVYESASLGPGGGVTLSGKGIFVNPGAYSMNNDYYLMQHEYGHIIQADQVGKLAFYTKIAPASLASASINPAQHYRYWTEVWANNLSFDFFNHPSLNRGPIWNSLRFPLIYNSPVDLNLVESFRRR